MSKAEEFEVVVVGAGFAGLYMLHRLRGLGLSAVVLEAGEDVGGTWYWNRYPGARCDVESMQYSYSFSEELQQEWRWSERFASQPEILRYANHVADRFDLRRDIRFSTRVVSAAFDDAAARWTVRTEGGAVISARHCVMATGCLSNTRMPDFPGLGSFHGKSYHTGQWPHEGVDFTGLRVGVIGTGSSAIQAIPVIARQARHVTVFQRTPNFSIPSRNRAMDEEYEHSWKGDYPARRAKARQMRTGIDYPVNPTPALEVGEAERRREYESRWERGGTAFMAAFGDLILDEKANETAADFVRGQIRATVSDPAVAELLCPHNHPIGTKRICVDTDYYETFNRENVTLVDVRSAPIEAVTPEGLRTAEAGYKLDALVFATGFDAMTGTLLAMDIRGRDGLTLGEKWEAGPVTYLGLMTAGFPNLFLVTGPGSPSVLSNMIVSIEQHVDWIAGALAHAQARGIETMEATAEAEAQWVEHGNEVAQRTLYPRANSWYMGVNVPGKPQVFMPYIGGVGAYREICDAVAAKGYEGFRLEGRRVSVAAE
ncbi:NAD(P)/FAD-dependent oxidoreductase [Roseococcus sp. SYP-B2431]|uniref:flavin-containing monooxygenase n=1 Tax=Roseococcus sp. SYP-B2431 TaxID=2496640 RepID=UPI00103B7278|nr:NAD(P)/FAD-dependent oxidoreductase [Roseococcus sp. SYP-B2431]TCH99522.1 NAD(P)/FAD-dependent oxidoreductase [Roseococcus sp. SYP-B2431]